MQGQADHANHGGTENVYGIQYKLTGVITRASNPVQNFDKSYYKTAL